MGRQVFPFSNFYLSLHFLCPQSWLFAIEYSMKDSLDPSLAVATIFDLHYEAILEVLSAHIHCHSPDHYGYSGQDFFHSSWYLNSCLFLLNY
jgi:hypothetical protein